MQITGPIARSIVAGIFLLASTSFGQRSNFRTYAHDQGLTDLNIVCLLQDRTGFLWVGTDNGLFRYDGNRFQRFGREAGLPVAAILTLAESIDGELWVGTLAGISRRVGDRFESAAQRGLNSTQGAQTLTPNRAGPGVYAATARGVVSLARGRNAVSLPGTEGRAAWSVLSDARDSLWYAQEGEVCHWSGKQARCFGKNDGVPPDTWGGLAIDGGGTVWARSAARLIALSKGSERFEDKTAGLAATLRNGLLSVDQSGKVMVPTDAGMAQQIAGTWSLIDRSDGLPVSAVTTALEDREGSLWIGLRGGGLARRLGSEEWESWTSAQGLDNDQVWAITRDQSGNLLVGTGAGLYRLADGKINTLDELRFNSSSNRIRALATDTNGSVWLGTSPGGLARRDIKTGSVTRFEGSWEGIRVQRVLAVAVDRNQNVWAAGTSVFRFTQSGKEWSRHQEQIPGSGQSEVFSDVREDREGRIWVAGDEGLAVWEGHSWTRLRPPLINLPRGAQHLAVSPDGSLWASFRDTARVTQIVRANGQWVVRSRAPGDDRTDSDRDTFLGFDKLGRLWRGTGAGVYMLSGNHWIHYGSADGLAWDDTSSNAFFSDPDGSVWIGTSRGLSHHRESSRGGSLQASLRPPVPVIVNVRSGQNNMGTTQPLRIGYTAGNVTVQYSTPTFRDQRNVRFRYRLKGWSDKWIETQEAEARFGGITPGSYVFEVNAGLWSEKWGDTVASIPLMIDGPLWMRREFWIGLAALSGILLIVAWRLREMLHQKREKNLGIAVDERTFVIDNQRLREQARNHILEMLLGNQPLNTVFEHALGLMLAEAPGTICALLIRQGYKCRVASQLLLPAGWQAALEISHAVPFEVWQKNKDWQNPGSDPAWKIFHSNISGDSPARWESMPVISSGSTVGALLYCWPTESTVRFDESSPVARQHTAEVVTQLVRLALDHNRLYEDLKFQIGHDPLTGLGNRVLWEEQLAAALDEAQTTQQKVAILYFDLDRFKEVNDTLNHRAGDIYLHEVAQRMRTAVRPADFVARIGGDEFTVLIPNIQSVEEAIALGERILSDMKVPLRISGLELEPGASVGVAIYPDDAVDGTQLQRFADSAMYHAKQSGGGRVCAFPRRMTVSTSRDSTTNSGPHYAKDFLWFIIRQRSPGTTSWRDSKRSYASITPNSE